MEQNIYKIGDIVMLNIAIHDSNYSLHMGDVGTVVGVFQNVRGIPCVNVDWGRDIGGHACGGKCPDGHGWNVPESKVTYAQIVIDNEIEVSESDFCEAMSCLLGI